MTTTDRPIEIIVEEDYEFHDHHFYTLYWNTLRVDLVAKRNGNYMSFLVVLWKESKSLKLVVTSMSLV